MHDQKHFDRAQAQLAVARSFVRGVLDATEIKEPLMEHTPTPWHAKTQLTVNDLSFILAAVNAHDELVAALEDAASAIADEVSAAGDDKHPIIASHIKTLKRARAALAKVTP